MRLTDITPQRVEEYLQTSQTVLLCIGSIESHGHHMPLGTDTLIPDKIAALVEEKSPVLIAPTIPYGATDTIMGCPGTVSLGVEGLMLVLRKVLGSLYRYGFRKFVILNGHGGNIKAIETVGMEFHRQGAWVAVLNWWLMAGELRPEWKGGHGGAEETAAIMGVNPSLVDLSHIQEGMDMMDDVSPEMPTIGWGSVRFRGATVNFPRESRHYFGNGWYGPDAPHLATPEWGQEMLQTMADYIVEFLQVLEGVPLPGEEG